MGWKQITDSLYANDSGITCKREYGKTPNGNDLNGMLVLRSISGEFVDFDRYRNDLFSRYGIKIESEKVTA